MYADVRVCALHVMTASLYIAFAPRYKIIFEDGMGGSTNNFTGNVVNRDPAWTTYLKYEYIGASALAQQVWGKPLPGNAWALLAINGEINRAFDVSVPLSLLNITSKTATFDVLDIWTGGVVWGPEIEGGAEEAATATATATDTSFKVPTVGPRDSGFYKLTFK